jgi:hypothetical protein
MAGFAPLAMPLSILTECSQLLFVQVFLDRESALFH